MELAHSLLLNEEALKRISEVKKPVFIFEWLRFLDKVLIAAHKSDIKEKQGTLVKQLTTQIGESLGPPARKLLARCLATLFSVGDTSNLFDTINRCNDLIRTKDDSPSYLSTKLAAITCIGAMYERLGRMVGRSFEETVSLLIKSMKNAESQGRCELMLTLKKVLMGMGSVASGCHKDIYKAAKHCMTDNVMSVRSAAAQCLYQLTTEATFMTTSEVDSMTSLCFRSLDGSNYDVRCAVGRLLGHLYSLAIVSKNTTGKKKPVTLDYLLDMLSTGFLRGGSSGFLKSEVISGAGQVNREIRVGVTHAYVEFVKCMGGTWLERNISSFLKHVLYLVANPKATPTHVDAVYARKCVQFILRTLIGSLLGEKAQISAAKEICNIIVKEMNSVSPEAVVDSTHAEVISGQHVLVCSLHELGCLVQTLGTSAGPLVAESQTGIVNPVISVLLHPSASARIAAAWCLRCTAIAIPSQITLLIERCMESIEKMRTSPEAVSGYSYAMAALLGGVYKCPLGIPHLKGKKIFSFAEDLLKTATQNSRLSVQKTQCGWLLFGAIMTLGPPVVKHHLPRILLLWRNVFPKNKQDMESENSRGDAFTWQVTLEGRAGALCAMASFIRHCQELVTEDLIHRLLIPLECALTMLAQIPKVIKEYGTHLKASAAMVRLRLYQVMMLLPPDQYEVAYSHLLRELVSEFTLTDNLSNTTTSLLRSMCHVDDSVILGSWLQETDHKPIEDQLQPNSASGSGALEHDGSALYKRCPPSEHIPGPLPLGVNVIDCSVRLFGLVFRYVPHKHRLQMLQHFGECIKHASKSRQQAIQMNIFTAVLCALKCLADSKSGFGHLEVRKAAVNLVLGALGSHSPILRCAAGEALGRIAQVVEDGRFIAELSQYSFDKLKSARDVITRTGHSLALGCLHRYVGGMGSGQHLNTSVSILLALAQDSTSPIVQVWALHGLGLIADSGGPMFRAYIEPTLSLVLGLLLSVPTSNVDVYQCLGKCLSALITSIGPELQSNNNAISTARLYCMVCCAIMQDHYDSLVQAEAISCLQQLHMFAPRHVNLTTLVPHLCNTLNSSHLLLRRAAVACLRQLSQREAREISEHAITLINDKDDPKNKGKIIITETGLEGALFQLLDRETDSKLCKDVHDTIISMLHCLSTEHLTRWFSLLKDVLAASIGDTNDNIEDLDGGDKEEENDDVQISVVTKEETHPSVAPRWPTRVFATDCMQKIITECEHESKAHFDLIMARKIKDTHLKGDFLVFHLTELVRVAFIAATSDSDQLRLAGLGTLQDVINKFSTVPDPEVPGHVILEQYQAQVGAALRPAFAPDAPSDVTAAACKVCSTWIGSGVARDLNDLRRVHQLLVSSLEKLKLGKSKAHLYSESASTIEKLAVLKAWAEVYIVAMQKEKGNYDIASKQPYDDDYDDDVDDDDNDDDDANMSVSARESLLGLVQPELVSLSKHWMSILKDQAYLSLPVDYSCNLTNEGGTFYAPDTADTVKSVYKQSWPPVLYAVSLWLNESGFGNLQLDYPGEEPPANHASSIQKGPPANMHNEGVSADRFHLLFGIAVAAMCSPTSIQPIETVTLCLKSVHILLDKPWPRTRIGKDPSLSIELLNVLHRLLLTRELLTTHKLVLDCVQQIVKAAQENLEELKTKETEAYTDSSHEVENTLGEGGESGRIEPGKSMVFATLEVCLCVLIRQLPEINPNMPNTGFPMQQMRLSEDGSKLVSTTLQILSELPDLCSFAGSVSILPTVLYLTTGVIRELASLSLDEPMSGPVSTALQTLKTYCAHFHARDKRCANHWIRLLQSAMATVLHFAYSDEEKEKPGIDETIFIMTLTVFILNCEEEVTSAPQLRQCAITAFQKAWLSKNTIIKLKCVQALTNIFQHSKQKTSTPYIRNCAPHIIDWLSGIGKSKPTNQEELSLVIESVKMLETLIAVAEDCNRIGLLVLLVPILMSYIIETSHITSLSKTLHSHALQRLNAIGPQYPEQFKTVMTSNVELRSKLQSAVESERIKSQQRIDKDKIVSTTQQTAKPVIKLKMDFSNFK